MSTGNARVKQILVVYIMLVTSSQSHCNMRKTIALETPATITTSHYSSNTIASKYMKAAVA